MPYRAAQDTQFIGAFGELTAAEELRVQEIQALADTLDNEALGKESGSIVKKEVIITNDVTSSLAIADNAIVRGDGGDKGVQSSSVFIDDDGNIGIGTASPTAAIDIEIDGKAMYIKRTAVFDFVQYNRITGDVWTDITTEAGKSKGTVSGDVLDIIGDTLVMGKATTFESIYIDVGTARSSTGTFVWEYWNGASWATLTCTDNTTALLTDGTVTFTAPVDWATTTLNGSAQLYFVRLRAETGTFTTEPTVYLVIPGDGTNVAEIYANANDTSPTFRIDAQGNVYIATAGGGTTVGTLTAGAISGSTLAASGTITDTVATTGFTHVGGLILNGPAATAAIPSQNSPVQRFSAQGWNGFVTKINSMDIYVNPDSEPITQSRMAFKNTTENGYAEQSELMNLDNDGTLSVLGRAISSMDSFDSVQHYVNSAYVDDTLIVQTLASMTVDVLDVVGNFLYIGKRNTFTNVYFDFNVIMSSGTTRSWEYWNGTAWTALTVTDGTNNWANNGDTSFTAPVDWAKTTVNNVGPIYYIRVGTVSGTFSVEPTLRFCLPQNRVDIFSNGEMDTATGWDVTGDWTYSTGDHTFTFSSGSGTLKQTSANFANPAKPNTWYRFRLSVGTVGPATTVAYIGEEFACGKTYFKTDSTTEVDVFFKSNSNPGDFVIYTTATATSGLKIDAVELIELTDGDIMATGNIQAKSFSIKGGTSGIVTIQTNDVAGTYTLTLPATDGEAGQVLVSDGSGVLSWSAAGGVAGPATNNADYIPQWNGADSKTLKDGIPTSTFATSSHAARHLVGGADTIFPADPGADKYLIWDDSESALAWADGGGVGGGATTALDNLASVAINTTLVSDTDNTDALGTAAISWSDLFLGNGSVITWSSAPSTADVTLTHSANTLTLAGGDLALGSNNLTMTGSLGATGAGKLTKIWSVDAEFTNLPTINGGTLATALSLSSYAPIASPTFTTQITTPSVLATANDSGALGASGTAFSDLFLASGGVINWLAGAATITHSANTITFGGSAFTTLAIGATNITMTGSLATTGSRVTKGWFSDLEITNLPTVNGGTLATALSLGTMASETATNYVAKSLYDANSILYATSDNTPAALTIGASTIVGRKATGDIVALTATETRTILNVADGATANAKATGAELDTGTDDTKFATAKAIKDSHNVPSVAPGTSGNVLTSNGTDWTSAAPSGGGFTSRVRAYRGTSVQAIDTGYANRAAIQFNAESYDGDSEFDSSTNYRFTATTAGYYAVTLQVEFTAWASNTGVELYWNLNGTEILTYNDTRYDSGTARFRISEIIYLGAGQYLGAKVAQYTGSSKNVGYGTNSTFLTIHRLS